ncbi:hypothetical protein AB1K54_16735 [Microbacterium sp. BWT-B31]
MTEERWWQLACRPLVAAVWVIEQPSRNDERAATRTQARGLDEGATR